MLNQEKSKSPRANRSFILLLLIAFFSAIYRVVLVLYAGFPPGADIGLHGSLIHSITQGGSTNFMWNFYHMGGGNSNTFPGFHIFVSYIILLTGLPDYLAEALVTILFSTLLVFVSFLITRKLLNQSIALIVALLVGASYYDIYILLWSGYPNVITLMLIPLFFYLLLEKSRFQRLPLLTVASLISAAIFLTHSLSAFMFVSIIFVAILVALCFPGRMGINRRDVLEWLLPLFAGGLLVTPFLLQAAPFYLNLNSPVYTGGLPGVQELLLPIRLVPLEFVLPFAFCFLLCFVFFRLMHVKIVQFSAVLLILWLVIPTALTQSYLVGFYMDYERFLYFAALPLIILVGTGIFLGARYMAKSANQLLLVKGQLLQSRFGENRILRQVIRPHHRTLIALFTTILILAVFFELPHFSLTPYDGLKMQNQQQVMNQPGYEAIQWIKVNTPANSVFVADALYGWWLGGFAQRPTISACEPVFLTNSREFEPAQLATRLLDTDYLVDNGLIQVKEDGGYIDGHNPEFLAKLNDSYYPLPFLNFNNSQTTITFSNNGDLDTVKLSELQVREAHVEQSSNSATILTTRGNEFLNFTQSVTVLQGVRFVDVTETFSSNSSAISFSGLSFIVQTRGNIVTGNGSSIELKDPYSNVAGQLLFIDNHPVATQVLNGPLEIVVNGLQNKTELNFKVGIFEYPNQGFNSAPEAGLQELFRSNIEHYSEKVADYPLDVFDYRQAIANLSASYIAVRDYSQIPRFVNDPSFNLAFVNKEVSIFQVKNFY